MATVSGTFTAVGQSAILNTGNEIEQITIALSGTYVATVELQRAVTPDPNGAWERVAGPFSTANATVSQVVESRPNDKYRLACTSFTSGTVTYSVADGDVVLKEFVDRDGNVILRYNQSGMVIPGSFTVDGASTLTGATTVEGSSVSGAAVPIVGTVFQAVTVWIRNNGGTIEWKITHPYLTTDTLSPWDGFVQSPSATYGTLSALANASNPFTSGGKIRSDATHVVALDTIDMASTPNLAFLQGDLIQNTTSDEIEIEVSSGPSLDINGDTRTRPQIVFTNRLTGADYDINATNIAAGEVIRFRLWGYMPDYA